MANKDIAHYRSILAAICPYQNDDVLDVFWLRTARFAVVVSESVDEISNKGLTQKVPNRPPLI